MAQARKRKRKLRLEEGRVMIYDTTLRDGSQAEGISFSLEDKLDIARELDAFGVDYIEGGWPGSNPKDMAFFKTAGKLGFKHSKLAAFGSTRRAGIKASADKNMKSLVGAATPVITVFGKSWRLHVKEALRTSLAENLRMIEDSLRYLTGYCPEVVFDAEHFFDGYADNPDYALKTLASAVAGGASWIVLCDTNGGRMPDEIAQGCARVVSEFGVPVGIHCHNDSGVATAGTQAGVQAGACMVHGTVNGFGERCGNADLMSVIPNLQLKMNKKCLEMLDLQHLTRLSRYVYDLANLRLQNSQPFVGRSAFAHKGGIHVSAVNRNSETYEHIDPKKVGNARRILVSELSGRSNVLALAGDRYDLSAHPEKMKAIIEKVQDLENQGYQFEAAEASFDLLVRKAMGDWQPFFNLHGFRVSSDLSQDGVEGTQATIKLDVNGQMEHTAAEGNGPVNALDGALRKALEKFYPSLADVQLIDFKVRVINAREATAAKVRVTIESSDSREHWHTVGVSENIIEASWNALLDSVEYKLLKERDASRAPRRKRQAKRRKST
jgi:2-isopropylmalate synthase